MKAPAKLKVKDTDVVVMVGTTKGAWFMKSDQKRGKWETSGPHFPGLEVHAFVHDNRAGRNRIYAGVGHGHFGPTLQWSDDFGKTWTNPKEIPVKFPQDTGAQLKRVWQLELGAEPDVLYAGVEPAALFESRDAGATWSLVRGLWNHPHREKWQPGGGGLTLHTIVPHPTDPKRLHVAISTGGVYRTDDGGASWRVSNKGVRAEYMPDKFPEFGQCVHKIVRHPKEPDVFFLQNHWGLYKSENAGDEWKDIAKGVPSDFGFAMAAHAHQPGVVYIVPIESDQFRATPEAKLRVYRTENGGKSWKPLAKGLPQENAYECVLRDAMSTDQAEPCGVYFGTRTGKVFGSANEGDSWKTLMDGLPPVLCVKTMKTGAAPQKKAGKAKR